MLVRPRRDKLYAAGHTQSIDVSISVCESRKITVVHPEYEAISVTKIEGNDGKAPNTIPVRLFINEFNNGSIVQWDLDKLFSLVS